MKTFLSCGHLVPGLLLLIGFCGGRGWAQTVTRGPYLQSGSHTSVVVRWRTDVATDSRVRFGTNLADLNFVVDDSTSTTEHEVLVPGVAPDTKFFYSVGTATGTLAGNDPNHFMVTAPPPGTATPTRVWVIGDAGTQTADQVGVRDAYEDFTGLRHTDLWLMLGDNAYLYGTDLEYQLAVFNVYTNLLRKSVVWPTLGNHDTYSVEASGNHAYFDIFTLPTNASAGGVASGTEHYYSFDHGRIHFVCLDSMESVRSPGGAMARWLTNDLASTTSDWIVAFWHHAPYTRGSHDSDEELELIEMRQNLVPLLEQGGVDLVLSGHSHSYERSYLLDGQYGVSTAFSNTNKLNGGDGRESGGGAYHKPRSGPTPHYGAVYAVVGSSGWTSGGTLDHPAMQVSLNNLGSLVLDITSNRLDATFLREDGATNDWFTMLKLHRVPVASNLTVNVTGDFSAALALGGSDADGLPITFATSAYPGQGIIASFNPLTGALTYAPAHGRVGPDEFTFRTHNGYLRSLPGIVTMNVLAPADGNTNGLPDYWEASFGITNPAGDEDGDGVRNGLEYVANTNPTNAASALRVVSATMGGGGECTIRWAAVGATRYRISYRDGNPNGPFTDVVLPAALEINPAPSGVAGVQTFTDDRQLTPPPVGGTRFYRIRAIR